MNEKTLEETEKEEDLREFNETAEYPLGGMIEPYDIEREKE
jgi:hypothetical protein